MPDSSVFGLGYVALDLGLASPEVADSFGGWDLAVEESEAHAVFTFSSLCRFGATCLTWNVV